jgi:hypothetical protein
MRFEVLTAASVKMAVFWYVAPCILVEGYRRFGDVSCPRGSEETYKYILWASFRVAECYNSRYI